ncbi:MAG: transglycosylase SLT domain-containing protein [Alphaproteobacteria bacterium]
MRRMPLATALLVVSGLALASCAAPPTPRPTRTPVPTAGPIATTRVAPCDPLGRRAEVYAAALRAEREGRVADARAGYDEAVRLLPEIGDHAAWRGARLAARERDLAGARSRYDDILRHHPDSVWFGAAAIERGKIDLDEHRPADARAWFRKALETGDPAIADEAMLGEARAMAVLGQHAKAYAITENLRGKPGAVGEGARKLGESLERLGARDLGMSPMEHRLRAASARLKEGRAEDALVAIGPMPQPGGPMRAEVALVTARARAKQGSVDDALAAYSIAAESTKADVGGTAAFERAKLLWNKDRDDEAQADFESFVARFPRHEKAPEAMNALGRIAESRKDYALAAKRYDASVAAFPADANAADTGFRAGFARWLGGDPAGAAKSFAALGDGRDEAVYWRAKSLAAAGDKAQSRALLERLRERNEGWVSWYVDRELGTKPPAKPAVAPLPDPPAPLSSAPPPVGTEAAAHWTRGEVLRSIGERKDAAREYAAVEAGAGPQPFLLDAYRGSGDWMSTIRLARRIEDAGTPVHPGYSYPQPFGEEYERAARETGLDPLLLMSLSRQESLFDANARSPVGARGVMQLMPTTAARVAGPGVDDAALSDPATNIAIGSRYLRQLVDENDGRLVPAIAAYNAGPGALARWKQRAAGRGGDEFIELISYRETKGYVKAVLRNYRAYRAIAGQSAAAAPKLY